MNLRPLSPSLGAEVMGLRLDVELDQSTVEEIIRAWHEHHVLLFRDQELSTAAQLAFARVFGELERVRTRPEDGDTEQYVMYVANRKVDGKEGVLPDGEMFFHSDQCYYERPCRATVLHALEVPPVGGDTLFANTSAAWETLPEELRERLLHLEALNVYDYDAGATKPPEQASPDAPRAVHPVVVRHPETRRPALYVNRLMTQQIVGMDRAESDALLAQVFEHQERAQFTYTHAWRPGDVVVWDNRATLHARTDFDPVQTRVLRRVTVKGERPVAADGSPGRP